MPVNPPLKVLRVVERTAGLLIALGWSHDQVRAELGARSEAAIPKPNGPATWRS